MKISIKAKGRKLNNSKQKCLQFEDKKIENCIFNRKAKKFKRTEELVERNRE